MYLDCFKNCGKDYLRIVNNKYSNNNGKVKVSRITVKNLGYLSNYDDGKPDLLKRLRAQNYEGKVVVVTSYANKATLMEFLKLKIDGYIAKPIDRQTLMNHLAKVLGRDDYSK